MSETVEWRADGTPFSPRFDDIYRSEAGALEQARHVFLQGCGLPQAWAGQRHWRVLETGFGLGLNFLAAWQAWRDDPARPGMLHFVSIEAWPADAADIIRAATPYPELAPLAAELAHEWQGLLPGFHRFAFDAGRVLLTLCVGDVKPMLRELRFEADAVFLDGFSPDRNPDMWDAQTLQAVSRLCRRGTRLATWTAVGTVKTALRQFGFVIKRAEGLPPKRHRLVGVFEPAWEPRRREAARTAAEPGRCIVIGAGLAGAAVAASLARRGWAVEVLDACEAPAGGASGLPAGLLAPHVSPDDNLLSRLTRRGARIALRQARLLLAPGVDWDPTGVLEHRVDGSPGLPAAWPPAGQWWSRQADAQALARAGLDVDKDAAAVALWHAQAAWIRPSALVHAWLRQPGIRFRGGVRAASLARDAGAWKVLDVDGQCLATGDLVVVASGPGSAALCAAAGVAGANPLLPLQPVRGQVSMGMARDVALPPFPVNGSGSLIPALPLPGGVTWVTGATFGRARTDLAESAADHAANLEKLRLLLPGAAARLAPDFAAGRVTSWAGVRCASPDRVPAVGPLGEALPGLWACTAMGSRGLSFAALCGELLAAWLHGEPLPVEHRLAQALGAARLGSPGRPAGMPRR